MTRLVGAISQRSNVGETNLNDVKPEHHGPDEADDRGGQAEPLRVEPLGLHESRESQNIKQSCRGSAMDSQRFG